MNIQAGTKYNRLTLTGNTEMMKGKRGGKKKRRYVEVLCDCGTKKWVMYQGVRKGTIKSCGCFFKDMASTTQGHRTRRTGIYSSWESMKRRCLYKPHMAYANYGGRGITVCDKWLNFSGFLEDMGDTWKEGLSIDRIDNNKGYSKDNCKWSTDLEQGQNKRYNYVLYHKGVKLSLAGFCRALGLSYASIGHKLRRGTLTLAQVQVLSVNDNQSGNKGVK